MLSSLDIICVQNQTFVGDTRVRRNQVTAELTGMNPQTQSINTRDIFEWIPTEDSFKQVGNSHILEEIKLQRAWSDEELSWQLNARRDILNYMVENDISDYESVTDIIRAFILDVKGVHKLMEDGQLASLTDDFEDTNALIEHAVEERQLGDSDVQAEYGPHPLPEDPHETRNDTVHPPNDPVPGSDHVVLSDDPSADSPLDDDSDESVDS
jgi:hypothetical protein